MNHLDHLADERFPILNLGLCRALLLELLLAFGVDVIVVVQDVLNLTLINLKKVSLSDERVVTRLWKSYSQ